MSGHFKVLDSALPLSTPTISSQLSRSFPAIHFLSSPPDTWGLILHEHNREQWELDCYQCQCLNDHHILNLNASVFNFIFQGVYIHQTYCNTLQINYNLFFVNQKPNSISGCLIVKISRLHTIRHTSASTHTHTHTHTRAR
jgi:hypothetical protein